ncbi:MAG: GNAT family N-acetyltransferase, partial [Actinobacteria bacterium]|nr:GNAT family N-acetyltransferase [Actinomycetota bacterium]
DGFEVRLVGPGDDLALIHAVAEVGFRNRGTALGPAGVAEAEKVVSRGTDATLLTTMHERLEAGLTVTAAVFDGAGDPVAVGAHQPLEATTEIVGVATLPAFRRRGLGMALTSALVRDALMRNCPAVFLSADDDEVAGVYEGVGFRRIGTAGSAEP